MDSKELLTIGDKLRHKLVYGPAIVYGEPTTQGDHSLGFRRNKVFIRHKNGKRLEDWRTVVAWTFRTAMNRASQSTPLAGCVSVRIDFFYPHPIGHYTKTGRKSKQYADLKTSSPDGDKLERAIFDALSRVAYVDDRLVVSCHWTKTFQDVPTPGAVIRVYSVTYQDDVHD